MNFLRSGNYICLLSSCCMKSINPSQCILEFNVAWGCGIRALITLLLLAFIIPLLLIITILDPSEIPTPIITLLCCLICTEGICIASFIFISPWFVTFDPSSGQICLLVSPFRWVRHRFQLDDVREIRSMYYAEIFTRSLCCLPTDWSSAICLELQSGFKYGISLKDTDLFIKTIVLS
jgi:hypothetical protein